MRKLLTLMLAVLLSVSAAFARNQRKGPIVIGFTPNVLATASTTALSASNTWLPYHFVPEGSLTLNKVQSYVSAVAGTLAATDLRLEILKDIAGAPSAAVTVQDIGDTVTLTAHPFANGEVVRFNATANGLTGASPADVDYYVCNKAANTFQVDATSSACAAIVSITSDGTNNVRGILAASVTVTATPAGALVVEWTGFSLAITGGTQYRALIRNMNAVPGTNYPTFRWGGGGSWPPGIVTSGAAGGGIGWVKGVTTDAGATWAMSQSSAPSLRLEYSNSTYEGIPISNVSIDANHVYANREVGAVFTTPANATLNVRCASLFQVAEAGTPTGLSRIRLYNGVTLLATSTTTWGPGAVSLSGGWFTGCFSSTQAIAGGSTVRVVLSETSQSDGSSNYYYLFTYTVFNDANSKALMPFDGSLKETYTTDSTASPVAFTDTDTLLVPFALLLDTEGPFAAGAAATGGTGRVVP
jgi:hypothetical protein